MDPEERSLRRAMAAGALVGLLTLGAAFYWPRADRASTSEALVASADSSAPCASVAIPDPPSASAIDRPPAPTAISSASSTPRSSRESDLAREVELLDEARRFL